MRIFNKQLIGLIAVLAFGGADIDSPAQELSTIGDCSPAVSGIGGKSDITINCQPKTDINYPGMIKHDTGYLSFLIPDGLGGIKFTKPFTGRAIFTVGKPVFYSELDWWDDSGDLWGDSTPKVNGIEIILNSQDPTPECNNVLAHAISAMGIRSKIKGKAIKEFFDEVEYLGLYKIKNEYCSVVSVKHLSSTFMYMFDYSIYSVTRVDCFEAICMYAHGSIRASDWEKYRDRILMSINSIQWSAKKSLDFVNRN